MPTSFPMNILSHSIPSDTNASSFPLHVSASLTATAKLDSSTAVTSLMPQYFGPAISASVSASIPALSLLDKRLNSTELTENECVKRSRKSCMLTSPSVVAPLIDWITQATTSLEEMRWEPTGYERSITKNDGKSNQKVLYSMRNPNEMINQLLER